MWSLIKNILPIEISLSNMRDHQESKVALVKVPPEISADNDVADIYEQYEELIEQFKVITGAVCIASLA